MKVQFKQLKAMSQIYVNEWTVQKVDNEPMTPSDLPSGPADGTIWLSTWDNWITPSTDCPYSAMVPMVVVNGIAADPSAYTLITGDNVRTKLVFNATPAGGNSSLIGGINASVLVSYQRTLFTDVFWENNLLGASGHIATLLLEGCQFSEAMDYERDPWSIVVKQAGRNALANIQVLLASLGRIKMQQVEVDLQRSPMGLSDTLNQLGEEITAACTAWRWSHSPGPIAVHPVRGPYNNGMSDPFPYGRIGR